LEKGFCEQRETTAPAPKGEAEDREGDMTSQASGFKIFKRAKGGDLGG